MSAPFPPKPNSRSEECQQEASVLTTVSFGPDSANKYITTYFRRAFVAPAGVLYTNLNLRLNRVDGAIVWLNGGFYEYREPLIQSQAASFYRLQYVGVPATGPTLGCVLVSDALGLSWPTNFDFLELARMSMAGLDIRIVGIDPAPVV